MAVCRRKGHKQLRGNILSTMYLSGKCVEVILDLNISDSSRSTVVVVKVVVQLVTFNVEEVVGH